MNNLINQIAACVEAGKINISSRYPDNLQGQKGAEELTKEALDKKVNPNRIFYSGIMTGLINICKKLQQNQVFFPDIIMSAKTAGAAMKYLTNFFSTDDTAGKIVIILNTERYLSHYNQSSLFASIISILGYEILNYSDTLIEKKVLDSILLYQKEYLGKCIIFNISDSNIHKIIKTFGTLNNRNIILIGSDPVIKNLKGQSGINIYSTEIEGIISFLEKEVKDIMLSERKIS
jgi:methanogenic corrinoid protein MtbC1